MGHPHVDEVRHRYQEWTEEARAELTDGEELSTPGLLCHQLSGELFRYWYQVDELAEFICALGSWANRDLEIDDDKPDLAAPWSAAFRLQPVGVALVAI